MRRIMRRETKLLTDAEIAVLSAICILRRRSPARALAELRHGIFARNCVTLRALLMSYIRGIAVASTISASRVAATARPNFQDLSAKLVTEARVAEPFAAFCHHRGLVHSPLLLTNRH